jgi:hypothetical protein
MDGRAHLKPLVPYKGQGFGAIVASCGAAHMLKADTLVNP